MPLPTSNKYWEDRAIRRLLIGEKSSLEYEKDLKKVYKEAIKNIKSEINSFYSKEAKRENITLSYAKQKLKPDEQKDFNAQSKKYISQIARFGDDPDYKSYLKKLSSKAYVTRLEELTANIRHEIELLSLKNRDGMTDKLKENYEDQYYASMFDVQKMAGIGTSFTKPSDKQLKLAVKESWLGANYSDRIWKDKQKLILELEQLIPQELVRGRGPNVLAQELSDRLGVSYNNSVRLIRTEMNHIANQASLKALKESGIVTHYIFLATLDSRTSDICREMDKKVFKLNDAVVGVNLPPLHPYCRSVILPHFNDDEIGNLLEDRIARELDGEGKSIRLGKDVGFFSWVKEYGSIDFINRVSRQREKFKALYKLDELAPLIPLLIPYQAKTEDIETGEEITSEPTSIPELNEKELKSITEKFEDFTDYEDDIKSIITNLPPEYQHAIHAATKKLIKVGEVTFANGKKSSGAFFQESAIISTPKGEKSGPVINIYRRVTQDIAEHYNIHPLTTLFHELGHAIDYKSASKPYHANKDYNLVKAMKKDLDNLLLDKDGHLYTSLKYQINEREHITQGIQDIIGGAKFDNKKYKDDSLNLMWEHSDEYWRRGKTDKEMASELFAHLTTSFINEEIKEVYSTYMPNSLETFEKIMKDIGVIKGTKKKK